MHRMIESYIFKGPTLGPTLIITYYGFLTIKCVSRLSINSTEMKQLHPLRLLFEPLSSKCVQKKKQPSGNQSLLGPPHSWAGLVLFQACGRSSRVSVLAGS